MTFCISKELLTLIGFVLIFIFYSFYKNRINKYILRNIDNIIFIILLTILYIILFNIYPKYYKDMVWIWITIFLFLILFLQYRITKESEIINEYLRGNNETTLKNFIHAYQILEPILTDQKNFNTLLQNKIIEIISEDTFESFKERITKEILIINNTLNIENLIILLKEVRGKQIFFKSKIKEGTWIDIIDKWIKDFSNKIKRVDYLIEVFSDINEKIYKKMTLKEKILNYLKP